MAGMKRTSRAMPMSEARGVRDALAAAHEAPSGAHVRFDPAEARAALLIETLGWTGAAFPRLTLHLDRLAGSATRLGRPCDRGAAEAALRAAAPPGPARMRLTLDAAGAVRVEAGPMPPAAALWRVGLAAERLASCDPWLTLKSTRREAYDRARARLAPGLDESVLLNERGEVCDGTITTVFLRRGGGLVTPPLACGVLPGVLRADLIAQGLCAEAVLTPRDLSGDGLLVGNSLRGLIPAQWRG